MRLFSALKNKLKRRKRGIVQDSPVLYYPKKKKPLNFRKRSSANLGKLLPSRKILLGFLGVLLAGLIITGIAKFINSESLKVNAYTFIGNKSISEMELEAALSQYNETSILLVNDSKISSELKSRYGFFKSVKVLKKWPNQLVININEREPKIALINLNAAYIIDEDAQVIDILNQKKINFSGDQLDIITGLGDPNADYVKDRLRIKHIESNSTSPFRFKKIDLRSKLAELSKIRAELLTTVIETQNSNADLVKNSKYANTNTVFAYDNSFFDKGSTLNKELLNISSEVTRFFSNPQDVQVSKIVWESEFSVLIILTNNREILFGTKRSVTEQLEDYVYINNLLAMQNKSYSRMDLSSKKVSVR